MINHKHKFIFIHVSKTGGTSIEHALNPNVPLDKPSISEATGNTRFQGKHWSARKYLQKYPGEYKNFFTFAFVRNPWDRMLSNYKWLKLLHLTDCSFREWIANPTWGFDAYSYQSMVCDHGGSIIVDYIGKFESLQHDFDIVCDKVGIPQQKLPHKNKTNHKHYTEYYDAETRQIVAEKYAKDIEYFGYKFGD